MYGCGFAHVIGGVADGFTAPHSFTFQPDLGKNGVFE
jgi:hypothetical protein